MPQFVHHVVFARHIQASQLPSPVLQSYPSIHAGEASSHMAEVAPLANLLILHKSATDDTACLPFVALQNVEY